MAPERLKRLTCLIAAAIFTQTHLFTNVILLPTHFSFFSVRLLCLQDLGHYLPLGEVGDGCLYLSSFTPAALAFAKVALACKICFRRMTPDRVVSD